MPTVYQIVSLMPNAVLAGVLAVLTVHAWRSRARFPTGAALAAYLCLVSVGYAVSFARSTIPVVAPAWRTGSAGYDALLYGELTLGAADGFMLLVVVATLGAHAGFRGFRAFTAGAAVGTAIGFTLVLALIGNVHGSAQFPVRGLLELLTLAVYGFAFTRLARHLADSGAPREPRVWYPLVAGLLVVTATRASLALPEAVNAFTITFPFLTPWSTAADVTWRQHGLRAASTALVIALGAWLVRRTPHTAPDAARRVALTVLVALSGIGLYWTVPLLGAATGPSPYLRGLPAVQFVFSSVYASRWFVATPFLAYALAAPGDVADATTGPRAAAARYAAVLAGFLAAFLVLTTVEPDAAAGPVNGAILALTLVVVGAATYLVGVNLPVVTRPATTGALAPGTVTPMPSWDALPTLGALSPGRRLLDRYHVTRPLGSGLHGRTFHAHDTLLGRDVALKEIALAGAPGDSVHRALREGRAAGSLDSPRIVTVLDVIPGADRAVLVMEYAPGGSLAEALTGGRTMRPRDAARVTLDVLEALEAAHAAGVLHRDVKPGNVLFGKDEHARLADFGLALATSTRGTLSGFTARPGLVEGTLAYMAPEQVQGASVDARADLHAAAALLHEMLTGRPYLPLTGEPAEDRARVLLDAPDLAHVPAPWRDVLARGLARSPQERYQTAAEFRGAVRRAMNGANAP